ncbi:hypothetical protein AB0H43_20330 [Hamadaea sp. NPDC050747]|uniref:hypothetical protein n=1 Tax=Hamadaea sp. NPDC050747 TaxID=3155789 RepID=UPI0033D66BCA
MTDFWAGAVSSLVGALVGGLATAAVAWMQLKAGHRQQLAVLNLQASYEARLGMADALDAASTAFFQLQQRHQQGEGPCPIEDYPEVERIQRSVNRAWALYTNALPAGVFEEVDRAVEFINLNGTSIARRAEEYAEYGCGFCDFAEKAEEVLYDAALLLGPGDRSGKRAYEQRYLSRAVQQ